MMSALILLFVYLLFSFGLLWLFKRLVIKESLKQQSNKVFVKIYFALDLSLIIYCLYVFFKIKLFDYPLYIQYRMFFDISTAVLVSLLSKIISFSIVYFVLLLYSSFIYSYNYLVSRITFGISSIKLIVFYSLLLSFIINFILLSTHIHGNQYNIRIERIDVRISDLPLAFDGLKIVQLSDLHLGSFNDEEKIKQIIEKINELHADLIVITGDIINVSAEEIRPYINSFYNLKSTYGKYAILGNHDIGDYRRWGTIPIKNENSFDLRDAYRRMGFTLLIDSNKTIVNGLDTIFLAGVNNIGLKPFKKTGNLQRALSGTSMNSNVILLSHDPSHWNMEVKKNKSIKLMLSGHTHAGQIAVPLKNCTFYPISLINNYISGLYFENNQYLYVNRGFGFLGFKGRIAMKPEIAVITLKTK